LRAKSGDSLAESGRVAARDFDPVAQHSSANPAWKNGNKKGRMAAAKLGPNLRECLI
jgi:hypothetical protein